MKIEYLQEFLVLYEMRNMSEAASALYISQPTLSKHIASIEQELRADLFFRGGSKLRTTMVADALYEDAQNIVGMHVRAAAEMRAASHGEKQTLILGYEHETARLLVKPIKEWFAQNKPNVNVRFVSRGHATLKRMMKSREVDVAIMLDGDAEFRSICGFEPLFRERLIVVMDRGNPLSKRDSLGISDLAECRLYRPDNSIYPELVTHLDKFYDSVAVQSAAPNQVKLNDPRVLFDLLESRGGVAVVAAHNEYMYRDKLAFVPLREDEQVTLTVSLMWLKESEQNRNALKRIVVAKKACAAAGHQLPASLKIL